MQWIIDRTLFVDAVAADMPESLNSVRSAFASGIAVLCAFRDLAEPPEAFQWDGSWFGHPGTELIDQVCFSLLN